MGIEVLFKKFSDDNKKDIKKLQKTVDKINALEPQMESLSDEELKGKTAEFKARLAKGETLNGRYRPASGAYFRDENR